MSVILIWLYNGLHSFHGWVPNMTLPKGWMRLAADQHLPFCWIVWISPTHFQIFMTGNYVQLPAIWANNGGIVNILIKFCRLAGKWLHIQCSASNNCFWGLAANIASKSRKKIMNVTIFQPIGNLLSGHHPYSQRDFLDTANWRVPREEESLWFTVS